MSTMYAASLLPEGQPLMGSFYSLWVPQIVGPAWSFTDRNFIRKKYRVFSVKSCRDDCGFTHHTLKPDRPNANIIPYLDGDLCPSNIPLKDRILHEDSSLTDVGDDIDTSQFKNVVKRCPVPGCSEILVCPLASWINDGQDGRKVVDPFTGTYLRTWRGKGWGCGV